MQLCYEKSWAKALSNVDKQHIETLFQTAPMTLFTTIRHAVNHRGHLLVTVLIRNMNDEKMTFSNKKIIYHQEGHIVAAHTFTIDALVIPPHSAMPWTFIFPHMQATLQPTTGTLQWINAQ